jgi:hypothetical protein
MAAALQRRQWPCLPSRSCGGTGVYAVSSLHFGRPLSRSEQSGTRHSSAGHGWRCTHAHCTHGEAQAGHQYLTARAVRELQHCGHPHQDGGAAPAPVQGCRQLRLRLGSARNCRASARTTPQLPHAAKPRLRSVPAAPPRGCRQLPQLPRTPGRQNMYRRCSALGGCDGAQGCSCFPPRLLTLAVALRQRWGAASHHGSAAGFRAPLQHIVQLVCCHLDNVLAAVAPQKQWRLWDAAGGCDGPVPRRVVAGLQVGVAKGTAWRVAVNWEPGAPHRNTSID